MIGWRGVVYCGEVWAWPTVLFTHDEVFAKWESLQDYTCRWRQWEPGGQPDFDPGCSEEDRRKVEEWLSAVHSEGL